ncbi:hypothetical protein [Fructobacillus ficulneus]|uniref:Predicted SAM-dependent methyltransferase n=1 Tax=Fructobacillus ficulneus TaxID=157463 RepID=A0A0K8MHR5_9LACO|nr:hypothetical protein [Fructobacillus ficulneus]GAP00107.1 predicted SAM-dependent methyltransferase [Fructobacillus ficulneus]
MLTIADLQAFKPAYQTDAKTLQKIEAVIAAMTALDKHQLPDQSLPQLLESVTNLYRHPARLPIDDAFTDLRATIIASYGLWFLPNQAWVADLAAWLAGRPVVELMAGNAAITAGLQHLGHPAQASDTFDWTGQDNDRPQPWTEVQNQTALATVQAGLNQDPTPVFLLSWAPDTSEDDWQVLQALRVSHQPFDLLVIGEINGATNSKKFWENAKLNKVPALNQNYQSFDNIDDAIYLVH